jgi:hypothetical protein
MARTGGNLNNGTIRIGKYLADDRFRIGGMVYLEERLGKSFEEIADDLSKKFDTDTVRISTMVRGMTPMLVALVYQRNSDMTKEDLVDVEKEIMRFELDDFTDVFHKVKLFESAKNASEPTSPKPRKRRKVVITPAT